MSEIQKVAKKVLKDESEGIELLKDFFDDNFSSAVKKIIEINTLETSLVMFLL